MKTKWVKKSTLGYSATQCFGIWGHGDSFIYGIMCFEIGLLLVLFATNIIIIVRAKSHLRDTITSVWYYVSHLRDTSFYSCFWHRKKFLAEGLSLDPCNTGCIHSILCDSITQTWFSPNWFVLSRASCLGTDSFRQQRHLPLFCLWRVTKHEICFYHQLSYHVWLLVCAGWEDLGRTENLHKICFLSYIHFSPSSPILTCARSYDAAVFGL